MGNSTLVNGQGKEILKDMYGIACAANGTTTVQVTTGAIGDYLDSITIIPITTTPGSIKIKDGSGGTDIDIFMGGASSVATLHSWTIALGWTSKAGAWYVTSSSANVKAVANGNFT